jgi:hypothetical protein
MAGRAVVLMVYFAGMWAMNITFVGAGGWVWAAGNPALPTKVTQRPVAVADAKASGAMMLPAAGRAVANGGLAAQTFIFLGINHLTDDVCDTGVYLTSVRVGIT